MNHIMDIRDHGTDMSADTDRSNCKNKTESDFARNELNPSVTNVFGSKEN